MPFRGLWFQLSHKLELQRLVTPWVFSGFARFLCQNLNQNLRKRVSWPCVHSAYRYFLVFNQISNNFFETPCKCKDSESKDDGKQRHVCWFHESFVIPCSGWILSVKVFRIFSGGARHPSKRCGVCAVSISGSSPFILPLQNCACPKTLRSSHWSASQSELTSFPLWFTIVCEGLQHGGRQRSVALQQGQIL